MFFDRLVVTISLILAVLSMAPAECEAFAFNDAQEIIHLLKERKFDCLEETIEKSEKAYQNDYQKEHDVFLMWKSFGFRQISYERYFNDWVRKSPRSPYAYLARAAHYTAIGWAHRGARFASETTGKQFAGMEYYHKKAYEDASEALELRPQIMYAYYVLLELAKSDRNASRLLFERALKFHPYSYYVRSAYLKGAVPRWGGSMEELNTFMVALRPYYDKNPRLRSLEGRLPIEIGDQNYYKGKYSEALSYYTEALTFGDSSLAYFNHGKALSALGKHADAIKSYDDSIRIDPLYPDPLVSRGWSYYKLKDYGRASSDVATAIELDPFDADALNLRGLIFSAQGQYERALNDLQRASRLDPASSKYQRTIDSIRKKMAEANK